jgi:succinylarginine dihydrolase
MGQRQNAFWLCQIPLSSHNSSQMLYQEINFDGIVGPTHNYAGLSVGNVASTSHKGDRSRPREAALQGLAKAKVLADRGIPQAVLPPHERPSVKALRDWGFIGRSDEEVIAQVASSQSHLLAAACSASAMWTANACTMTPSSDTEDGRAHFTPANLVSKLHRSIEAGFTRELLEAVFPDEERFVVHEPLPAALPDEGAANHTRLCADPAGPGLHLFVFGKSSFNESLPRPVNFPARQSRESFESIARLHGLQKEGQLHIQQSPDAIDAGVFHNDVISVGNNDLLFFHEDAFLHPWQAIESIHKAFSRLTGKDLRQICVRREQLSLETVVRTYLFNSQLVQTGPDRFLLVAPEECRKNEQVSTLLDNMVRDDNNPLAEVVTFNLRESMRNGGGPACLRQRVLLNTNELRHMRGRLIMDDALYSELVDWVGRHYREELRPMDLADPDLLKESRTALDELTQILRLPKLYPFQK